MDKNKTKKINNRRRRNKSRHIDIYLSQTTRDSINSQKRKNTKTPRRHNKSRKTKTFELEDIVIFINKVASKVA